MKGKTIIDIRPVYIGDIHYLVIVDDMFDSFSPHIINYDRIINLISSFLLTPYSKL